MITNEIKVKAAYLPFLQNVFELINFALDGGEDLLLFSKVFILEKCTKITHLAQMFHCKSKMYQFEILSFPPHHINYV